MAVTVQQAAVNALRAWLASELPDAVVFDRWPAPERELPPKAVTILLAGKARDDITIGQRIVKTVPLDPTTATYSWRFGTRYHPVRIDLWATSDYDRDDLMERVDQALHKGPKFTLGLPLGDPVRDGPLIALADGHEGYADFTFESPDPSFPETAESEWRASFDGTVAVDLIVTADSPRLLVVKLQAKITELKPSSAPADLYTYTLALDQLEHSKP